MSIIRRQLLLSGVVTCVIMASACLAVAQTPRIAVGDPNVSGQHIRPYSNQWNMTHRGSDGTERPAGRWIDTLEVVTAGNQEILRRTQVTYNATGSLVSRQVHIVDRRTMAPLRSHLSAGQRIKHVDFGPDGVSGFILPGNDQPPWPVHGPLHPQAFDFEMAGVLLVAFSLNPDDEIEFLSYELTPTRVGDLEPPTGMAVNIQTITATAFPIESVSAGKLGDIEAMPVVVSRSGGALKFWLANTPPYIIKLTSESPRGTTTWTMQ